MQYYIYYAIIIILILDFILDRYLSWLNIQNSKKELPGILKGIYDDEKYQKQQEYFRVNTRFGMITSTFSLIIVLLMYALGGFAWLDQLIRSFVDSEMCVSLIFFGILFIANDLLSIPFEWYDTFTIEQKFGFNKVTPGLFILDKLKSYGVSIIIGGGILFLIISIYQYTPKYFWLLAWASITIFSLFMSMFYSQIIVPLFNKQTPLPEGELRTEIEKFSDKAGFNLKNIYVIDGSKRSTKANAYFTGLGSKKRIVLYDTLMDKLTTREIVAVLAHEVGHYKNKHIVKNLLISVPSSLLVFYLLGLILRYDVFAQALGAQHASFHMNMLVFAIIYSPVSLVVDLISNQLSRKHEYQADKFAADKGLALELQSGLKKLSETSLSNLMPHPKYVFFHYSHPTLYQRLVKLSE